MPPPPARQRTLPALAMPAIALRFSPLALCSAGLAVVVSGCSTVHFYTQAIAGQAEILRKARPIGKVLADPAVSARASSRKLALVQEARRYAADALDLAGAARIRSLHRPPAPLCLLGALRGAGILRRGQDLVVPFRWQPGVSKAVIFRKKWRTRRRARLRVAGPRGLRRGSGGPIPRWGNFHDPVLNTFFHRTDAELAEVIFHELTHVKLFLPGDSDFNEAFATARRGRRRCAAG